MNNLTDIRITEVFSAIKFSNSLVGVTTYNTNRKRFGIILKIEGQTIYRQGENQFFSDSNHIIIIPKGASYSFKCIESGECLIIDFDASGEFDSIFSLEISDTSPIVKAFSRIERALAIESGEQQVECIHAVYGILSSILKGVKKEYISSDKHRLVQPAVDYMIENYADSALTNDTLSKLCDISTVYFRKTFQKAFGMPPIKYLHKLRISKAKSMLRSDYDSIAQIAESVGYNSIYHFSKMFKQYVGKSPAEYAKDLRK